MPLRSASSTVQSTPMRRKRLGLRSRWRHGRLQRADGGALRRLLLRLHRPVAAAAPGPHLPVNDAAQVSRVTIVSLRTICIEVPRLGKLFHNVA